MKYNAKRKQSWSPEPFLAPLKTRFENTDYVLGICGNDHVFTMEEEVWIENKNKHLVATCPVLMKNKFGNYFRAKPCKRRILGMDQEFADKNYILTKMKE